MPSGRPATKVSNTSTARTVHIDTDAWDRIMEIAFRSKPRRSASDIVREMIDRELPKFEKEVLGK
ncbi:MAG: hypothetical protein ACOYB2_10800 [Limnohabitans sp.]